MPLIPGTKLGAYEILGPLGAGAMGEVYRARDLRLGREVAIKMLPGRLASDPDRLARFEREARLVAALNHPNVVTLYSVEDRDGIRFLTMEVVEGRPLTVSVLPGGLSLGKLLELGIPLTDALVAAHAKGVVHRDLKPGNVMVTHDGRIKVLDFGLARLDGDDSLPDLSQAPTLSGALSVEGVMVGTAPYMSPEQVRGEIADARSDLFSLGIILYELATGLRPFQGATIADVTSSILRDTPPSSSTLRSDLPSDLTRIISRCLEKDPERRIQTARDVCNELEIVRQVIAGRHGASPSVVRSRGSDLSIAVLPFENRSQNEEDAIFADGMTEDVIAQLCKVRNLKVISRTSVMPFKGRRNDLQAIASKLGVAHILEGSVRRVGDRVRIVAQLVDPETGRNLWAETYDRQLTDIFGIQTDVALQLASALRTELTTQERERIGREPTQDVVAYEIYMRGRQQLLRFNVDGYLRAIQYFEEAIARDAGFAIALAALAISCTELAEHGARARDQVGPRALAAGGQAVAIDPELSDGHCALAFARGVFEMDHAAAEAGFRRALELSPGNSFACDLYGRLCAGLGRFDEAIALQERAQELDPMVHRVDLATSLMRAGRHDDAVRQALQCVSTDPSYARGRATLGWALFHQGRVSEGLVELERASTIEQGEDIWYAQLGQAYALAGDRDRAREVLRRLENPARSSPASPYHIAYVHTGLGDLERAMDCLERAHASGSGSVYSIKGSFLFAPLRNHPRFTALLERMGVT